MSDGGDRQQRTRSPGVAATNDVQDGVFSIYFEGERACAHLNVGAGAEREGEKESQAFSVGLELTNPKIMT